MDDLETQAQEESRHHGTGLADLALDVALPTMAALLTMGIFLLAVG